MSSEKPSEAVGDKVVYLMRGLPSCGKSHAARRLAGDSGTVCETDDYFFREVGDDPDYYDYRAELMEDARQWNLRRFEKAIAQRVSPIVVDRGNSLCMESRIYARHAVEHGYRVELKEPTSDWWQEIRVLLKYKRYNKQVLYQWADRLSAMSRSIHRVPASTIRGWMDKWKWNLTIDDILQYEPEDEEDDATS